MQSLFGRIPQPKPRMTVSRRAKEEKKAVAAIPAQMLIRTRAERDRTAKTSPPAIWTDSWPMLVTNVFNLRAILLQ